MRMLLLADLRSRWLELSLAGVVVALVVSALVATRAVTSSAESAIHDLAHRLGGNMLLVPADVDLAAFYGQRFGPESLRESVVEDLRSSSLAEHLRSIEARLYGAADINGAAVIVVGQELGWPATGDVVPAVLGREAARYAGLHEGEHFRVGPTVFRVLEVADRAPDGLDRAVFMPMAAAQSVLKRPGQFSALRLGGCWCRVDVPTLARDVERLIPDSRAITVAGMINAQKGSVATMQRYSGVLSVAGLASVAAVVAALTASMVRRRSKEIALLVGVGAPPWMMSALLTAEAAAIGGLGALVGWVAAGPLTRSMGAHFGLPLASRGTESLGTFAVIAAAVCALAALLSSRRAATLDPTIVLREA